MSTPQLLKKKTNRDTNNETDTDKEANTEHQVIFNSTDEYKKRIEETAKKHGWSTYDLKIQKGRGAFGLVTHTRAYEELCRNRDDPEIRKEITELVTLNDDFIRLFGNKAEHLKYKLEE